MRYSCGYVSYIRVLCTQFDFNRNKHDNNVD